MDPWAATEKSALPLSDSDHSIPVNQNFDDNFQPFEKLPDSTEYLASLEKKLQKVQRGSIKNNNVSPQEILESLKLSHESCMVNLLNDSVDFGGPDALVDNADIKVNPILKKIAPEKQAIAVEELVQLVKADQLQLLLEESTLKESAEAVPLGSDDGTTIPADSSGSDTKKEDESEVPPAQQTDKKEED